MKTEVLTGSKYEVVDVDGAEITIDKIFLMQLIWLSRLVKLLENFFEANQLTSI